MSDLKKDNYFQRKREESVDGRELGRREEKDEGEGKGECRRKRWNGQQTINNILQESACFFL